MQRNAGERGNRKGARWKTEKNSRRKVYGPPAATGEWGLGDLGVRKTEKTSDVGSGARGWGKNYLKRSRGGSTRSVLKKKEKIWEEDGQR